MTEPTVDNAISDSDEVAEAFEVATVSVVREKEDDNHSDELRQRALTMFVQRIVPVRGTDNSVIGGFTVMECKICSGPVLPIAKSMITHMKQHLMAERRGDYNNA